MKTRLWLFNSRSARGQRCPARCRGGTYLLVLGMGSVLTVIGLAIGISGRMSARSTAADRDWTEAGVLAGSAAELAAATLNNESKWRAIRANDAWNPDVPLGHGVVSWKLRDELDNDLDDNHAEAVRIHGEAAVGTARRRFSVSAVPGATSALPVLSYALYSGTSITATAALSVSGGPLGTSGTMTNSAAMTGDVNAAVVANTGTIAGFVTTPAEALTTPGITIATTYYDQATHIAYGSLSSGRIRDELLTATRNPYGSANAAGIYFIRVPAGSTLVVRDSIIRATLVVQLQTGSKLLIERLVAWEPPSANMPSLIVVGNTSGAVTVSPDVGTVTVTVATLNWLGFQIGSTTLGSAPAELHGLFHVMGGATTSFLVSPRIVGTWIGDGAITISSATQIVVDPQIAANPPYGYTLTDSSVTTVPGSFRWESR